MANRKEMSEQHFSQKLKKGGKTDDPKISTPDHK
jgi:hypothetical protein